MIETTTTTQAPTKAPGNGGPPKPNNAKGPGRKRGTTIPPDESREAKFTRLTLQRMPNFKKYARLICNLADYPHSDAQKARIISEVRRMAGEVEAAFASPARDDSFSF
jgi:hypothetical protein